MKKNTKRNTSLVAVLLAILLLLANEYLFSDNSHEPNSVDGELRIHYIDVGQADSILLTLNDSAMLIDAGNNDDGDLVVNYLRKQGISSLDYVVGTHPHEDHIGGLDNVIKAFNIKTILMPKVQNTTKTFEDVLDAIDSKGLLITSPNVGDTYGLSTANFTILSCKNENTKELNSVSIVLRLVFGNQSYIFCGDAEKDNEYDMMNSGLTLKSNVIKVGHHGSTTSSLEKFILAVDPEIAIISVGKDNDYGHPHDKIIKRLDRLGIKTYRTDVSGTIVITSDGNKNTITVEKEE